MSDRHTILPTIADEAMFTFASQAQQFPAKGLKGITRWHVDINVDGSLSQPIAGLPNRDSQIDILLYRIPQHRLLVGILYHYRTRSIYERPGNINLFVHPDFRRQGIGTALVRLWQADHPINWEQQRYSVAGAHLAAALNTTKENK